MIFQTVGWIAVIFSLLTFIASIIYSITNNYETSRHTEMISVLWAILAVLCLK